MTSRGTSRATMTSRGTSRATSTLRAARGRAARAQLGSGVRRVIEMGRCWCVTRCVTPRVRARAVARPFGAESSRYCTEEGGEWGGWRGETYLPRRPRGSALEAGKAPACTRCPLSQTTPGHQRRSVSSQSRRAQCAGAATMQGAAAGLAPSVCAGQVEQNLNCGGEQSTDGEKNLGHTRHITVTKFIQQRETERRRSWRRRRHSSTRHRRPGSIVGFAASTVSRLRPPTE